MSLSQAEIQSVRFTVNGRTYQPPARPVVVICIDGCADEYLSVAFAQGRMPNLAAAARRGYRGLVRSALPSFTNVNNASIITGAVPRETGISGNFFLDPETGEQVMMNDARYLRCPTIAAAAAQAGRRVGVVTAKEKLRDILAKDLDGIAFSAEKADQAQPATHGIGNALQVVDRPLPEIYSGEASLFVLWAGAALLEQGLADFLYLSLTDYIQHKHGPYAPEALEFYERMDEPIGRLLEQDAIAVATADHGMNAKNRADGTPNVIYLESQLQEAFGGGIEVLCPITDPYVVHHGALGSLVTVSVAEQGQVEPVMRYLWQMEGVTEVYDRATAAAKLELPADRIGDVVVLGARDVALGRRPQDHDLSLLKGGLRTHGGRYEEMVPLIISEPLGDGYFARAQADPRNFDAFEFACNGVVQ